MGQDNEFREAMAKIRDILGEDFEDVLYEDIRQCHPNVLNMVKASMPALSEEISKDMFDKIAKKEHIR